ncbi:MAG: anthranilate phosphoribosyltransferase [Desulfovibrio sp.]
MENINTILEAIASRQDLTAEQADMVFNALFDGEMSHVQTGALLMGLRTKGETAIEIAGSVDAALKHAAGIPGLPDDMEAVDIVGTGGDNSQSFNCSTATTIFLANLGYPNLKHGNRSISSKCGSADALEELGIPLDVAPDDVAEVVKKHNLVFLFAPNYHPSFAHVGPVRGQLGIRTMFNFMGPLINPARPAFQLMGVGVPDKVDIMAETLSRTGVKRALVVHGEGGFDELTTFGPAIARKVVNGKITTVEIDPQKFGFPKHEVADVQVTGKEDAVTALRAILQGKGPQAMMDMVALNLGAAIHLIDDKPLEECMEQAKAAVAKGVAPHYYDGSFAK